MFWERTCRIQGKPDNMEIIYTGPINNDEELINLYNLADVMVTPSIQEAFGYTCCEALSCGTPVAAFDTSGLRDQIVHKENGYLARPGDEEDLREGILYCIENSEKMSLNAVKRVRDNNSYKVIGDKYLNLVRG